ncbi:MAG: NADH-quinone oxidoreductase subunit H [Clostridiales bacterium]|nr:NADH-quinone oxidoreductase subunit H [Clostridiales bacterium]
MMLSVIVGVGYLLFAPLLGGLLDGMGRVVSARMQGRKGPSVLQPFWDLQKLMKKELVTVSRMQLIMIGSYTLFVILSGTLFFGGNDIMMCFFSLTTADMFLVVAASCTGSPFSTMGANRELIQMASYEPMLLLTGVGFYLADGTFRVSTIGTHEGLPAIVMLPGFFIGVVVILAIKLRKSPFDISTSHHAHQEMVKGTTTELSGPTLACYTIADWYEQVLLMGLVGIFFANNQWWSVVVALVCIVLVYFFEVLIDNTCARVKWQLMFQVAWGVTLVAAGTNLLILQMIR